jgi:myo-inositol 2-dehydrogenase/D-chiro-inositol 1-dehydrogenase
MDNVRIAMLGVAHPHADSWAKAWSRQSEATLVGVWDEDCAAAQKWAEKFGATAFRDLDELLDKKRIDAVGICSQNTYHCALTLKAAEHGLHILCEKPTAITLEQCDAMIAALNANQVRYMQAFPMRVDPANQIIKEMLDKGEIGRVRTVRKRHGIGWAAEAKVPAHLSWFGDQELSGGGALLDEGIHAADFLIWMFGQPLSVRAVVDATNPRLKLEDNAIAIYEFKENIKAVLETSWTYQAATNSTEILGEAGSIIQQFNDCASTSINSESNFPIQVFSKRSAVPGWWYPRVPTTFMQIHEIVAQRFVADLVSGREFPSTIQNGRNALEMILATYRAAKEDRTVYLEGGNHCGD